MLLLHDLPHKKENFSNLQNSGGGGIYFYLLMEKTLLLLRNAIHFLVIATEQNKYIQISMQESECYIEKF